MLKSGQIKITCQMEKAEAQSGQRSCAEGDRCSLIVVDTGIGITPEDQSQIFQPYYRVGSQGNYLAESTGLGLAIVTRLVELLQGEINLISELGKGTTFIVTLPLVVKTSVE